MAATRLIPLHINKGKTLAQCLKDRTDYAENGDKTHGGELVTAYGCNVETADEEFLLSKRQYQHITGRHQKRDVIAYQIRQSFKPGEITPEEANEVGRETAMHLLKGNYAFIVATHTDRSHIHNHIIYNSTSLDCTRKFRNFFLSSFAIQRISDLVCLEHGLSVITPKPRSQRSKRTDYPRKVTQREILQENISAAMAKKPRTFGDFIREMEALGYQFQDGVHPAFRGPGQKRFIRLRSLEEEYQEESLRAAVAEGSWHPPRKKSRQSEQAFHLLIDIQAKMAEGKSVGYAKWAKKFNRKEAAKTMCLLKERGIDSYEELNRRTEQLSTRFTELSDSIKAMEQELTAVGAMKIHMQNYARTRQVYMDYRKAGYSKRFLEEHREEILLHKAAKAAFDQLEGKKLPSRQELDQHYYELLTEKKKAYGEYRQVKKEMQEYCIARSTVENILGLDRKAVREEQER